MKRQQGGQSDLYTSETRTPYIDVLRPNQGAIFRRDVTCARGGRFDLCGARRRRVPDATLRYRVATGEAIHPAGRDIQSVFFRPAATDDNAISCG